MPTEKDLEEEMYQLALEIKNPKTTPKRKEKAEIEFMALHEISKNPKLLEVYLNGALSKQAAKWNLEDEKRRRDT